MANCADHQPWTCIRMEIQEESAHRVLAKPHFMLHQDRRSAQGLLCPHPFRGRRGNRHPFAVDGHPSSADAQHQPSTTTTWKAPCIRPTPLFTTLDDQSTEHRRGSAPRDQDDGDTCAMPDGTQELNGDGVTEPVDTRGDALRSHDNSNKKSPQLRPAKTHSAEGAEMTTTTDQNDSRVPLASEPSVTSSRQGCGVCPRQPRSSPRSLGRTAWPARRISPDPCQRP